MRTWATGVFALTVAVVAACGDDSTAGDNVNNNNEARCGNGVVEGDELCDGQDLGGATCQSMGFVGGTLYCRYSCFLDTSQCLDETCGNGVREGSEQCDGADLGGQSCESLSRGIGTLACGTTTCTYDFTGCSCPNGTCELQIGEDQNSCSQDCGWASLSAGSVHTCGVRKDGTAWCWGRNDYGQLGDGTTTDSPVPVKVSSLQAVVSVWAGRFDTSQGSHTCAVLDDGTVWCWGCNGFGQLGVGTTYLSSPTPVQVAGLSDVVSLGVGPAHTCAVTSDGSAWCWGFNDKGQLGNGTFTATSLPTVVPSLTGVATISAGGGMFNGSYTCAAQTNGTGWCWGGVRDFVLGFDTNPYQPVPDPTEVDTFYSSCQHYRYISAGGCVTCGRTSFDSVCCWGNNYAGQTGSPDPPGYQVRPRSVTDNHSQTYQWSSVSTGHSHACGLLNSGELVCWGSNFSGQIGDGTTEDQPRPVAVPGFNQTVMVTSGSGYTCAITADFTAWCWGWNEYGQLGDGTTTDRLEPVAVSF